MKKIKDVIVPIVGTTVAMILFVFMITVACKGAPENHNISDSIVSGVTDVKEHEIMFLMDNIEDIIYYKADGDIELIYDDADVFDYDNMAFLCGMTEWYGDYIIIEISRDDVYSFLRDYHTYMKSEDLELCEVIESSWVIIEEQIIINDETRDFRYRLSPNM